MSITLARNALVAAILFVGSASAQNISATGSIGGQGFFGVFHGAGAPAEPASGTYSGGAIDEEMGWTWVRVGNDMEVYDEESNLVNTWKGVADTGSSSGPITDGPGIGNHGGS